MEEFDDEFMEISIMPGEEGSSSLLFYPCPKCKDIPEIRYYAKEGIVKINCQCETKKEITLEEYLSVCEKEKETLNCCKESLHGRKKADLFCTQCFKGYCLTCNQDHSNYGHKTINVNGLKLKGFCEGDGCKNKEVKNESNFYCYKCNKQFCRDCKSSHKEIHKEIKNIKAIFKQKDIEYFRKDFEALPDKLNKQCEKYNDVIKMIEGKIQTLKNLVEEKKKENEKIVKFFQTIFDVLVFSKDVCNFNVRKNPMNNMISQVQKEYFEKFNSDFMKTLGAKDMMKNIVKENEDEYERIKKEREANDRNEERKEKEARKKKLDEQKEIEKKLQNEENNRKFRNSLSTAVPKPDGEVGKIGDEYLCKKCYEKLRSPSGYAFSEWGFGPDKSTLELFLNDKTLFDVADNPEEMASINDFLGVVETCRCQKIAFYKKV